MQQLSTITKTLVLTGFSALSLWTTPAQAASFRGLGFLGGDNFEGDTSDVSADGSVVVGSSRNANGYFEAFRWTQETGMVGLGFLNSNNEHKSSGASGVSADGSVVVGSSSDNTGSYQAFRWTQIGGIVRLGFLDGDGLYNNSEAHGVSADGSIVVGQLNVPNRTVAFRWTQETGMVDLGFLAGHNYRSDAYGISADGSVVVGYSVGDAYAEAFRWTQADGMIRLGSDGSYSLARSASADGSVIVGDDDDGNRRYEAFRWTQADGMSSLGSFSSSSTYGYGTAYGVSADGYRIVGESDGRAFVWTQETGMVSLKETLIGKGLDLSGWSLTSATAISEDGFTIVGNGTNPSGQSEAWIANLSPEPVPEPLTILGSMTAIAFAASFERKFSKKKPEEKDPDA